MNKQKKFRINSEITSNNVRIIGENHKIFTLKEALKEAELKSLDLVEFSITNDVSNCKIMDYKKFIFDSQKNTKVQKELEIKEIKFSASISENDIAHKAKKVREFLERGHKIKISVGISGRGITHKELGEKMLEKFVAIFSDSAKPSSAPTQQGKYLSVVIQNKN